MSSENLKDAFDHGLYLNEVENKYREKYEDYLIDQIVFFRGVELQENNSRDTTRTTIRSIIKLLGG